MNKIQILDCTLRDGGYINDFAFSEKGIAKIIEQLTSAGIDIIECGFLENGEYDINCSIYNTVEQIQHFIPSDRRNTMYVAMACYGEYDLSQLSNYDGKSIDGIRVTFHYNEVDGAIEYCRQIVAKGYKVFVQPVGTTSYTDEQLLALIYKVNDLNPYSFYLVDTLGLMHQNDLLRFFYLINHNLRRGIHMGFHSHNNLQLSYSNCQALVGVETDRVISLDSSVYGMGRGAGNLNTELIANFLNVHHIRRYEVEPILEIVDEYIIKIKEKTEWGYSVPYYLAAINGCHPNYASYLSAKQTLSVKSISAILRMIEPENRSLFNKTLAEQKYKDFQSHDIDDAEAISQLIATIRNENVMLLAPGPSINEYREKLLGIVEKEGCIVVSVSFIPDFYKPNYVFLSNKKRYDTTFNPHGYDINLIHTSNIEIKEDKGLMVNYSSLLNEDDTIIDNSALMMLNLLLRLAPKKIYIAGMDGYNLGNLSNYYQPRLQLNLDEDHFVEMNTAISRRIQELSSKIKIEFVTPSSYLILTNNGHL